MAVDDRGSPAHIWGITIVNEVQWLQALDTVA